MILLLYKVTTQLQRSHKHTDPHSPLLYVSIHEQTHWSDAVVNDKNLKVRSPYFKEDQQVCMSFWRCTVSLRSLWLLWTRQAVRHWARSRLRSSNRTVDVAIPAAQYNHNQCFFPAPGQPYSRVPPLSYFQRQADFVPAPREPSTVKAEGGRATSGSTYCSQIVISPIAADLPPVTQLLYVTDHAYSAN